MNEDTLDIELFKAKLLQYQQELLEIDATGDAASQTVELDQTRVGRLSRMDALQAQAMSVATNQRRKLELQKIKAALLRIENNTYGHCLECGEMINPQRLLSNLSATLCISCANAVES